MGQGFDDSLPYVVAIVEREGVAAQQHRGCPEAVAIGMPVAALDAVNQEITLPRSGGR